MLVKDYVKACTPFVEDFYVDIYGDVVTIVEEQKLDTATMKYYTTCYIINGYGYAPEDVIERR